MQFKGVKESQISPVRTGMFGNRREETERQIKNINEGAKEHSFIILFHVKKNDDFLLIQIHGL